MIIIVQGDTDKHLLRASVYWICHLITELNTDPPQFIATGIYAMEYAEIAPQTATSTKGKVPSATDP